MPRHETTSTVLHGLIENARDEAARWPSDSGHRLDALPQIDGYELIAEIGDGAQGTVYQAIAEESGDLVAIKVIRGGPTAGSERRHRFEREIRALERITHPGIVRHLESGEVSGWFYSVMEFVEGPPIDTFVADSDLGPRATLELFLGVCDAVHAAHQRGILHRDLKPENIIVDPHGQPRVLDFGFAKLIRDGDGDSDRDEPGYSDAGRLLGTLAWSSPEQATGNLADVDVRSDVYSLGVVLYQILTGGFPYDVSNGAHDTLKHIVETPPVPPRRLNRRLAGDPETIVLTCLAKDPSRRYDSVASLAADIRRSLRGEAIDARRDRRLYVLARAIRRHRLPVAAAALTAVVGCSFGIVMSGLYADAAAAHEDSVAQVAALEDRIDRLEDQLARPANWTSAFTAAAVLRELDPEAGARIVERAWERAAEDAPARQQILKAVNAAAHPHFVRLMHLGIEDPAAEVRRFAFTYLRHASLIDFAADRTAYATWYEANAERPLSEIHDIAARSLVARTQATDDPLAVLSEDGLIRELGQCRGVLRAGRSHGLPALLLEVLVDIDDIDDESRRQDVTNALVASEPSKVFLETEVLPLVGPDAPILTATVAQMLARPDAVFAVEPLIDFMLESVRRADARGIWSAADALGTIGDVRAIPAMIAAIEFDGSERTIYGVGYFGLTKLTGVAYREEHDGAWWRHWWVANRHHFEGLEATDLPRLEQP